MSWVGLLHADQVAWAAAPQVALGYALLAAVLLGIYMMQGKSAIPPAGDDVQDGDVNEAGVSAASEAANV